MSQLRLKQATEILDVKSRFDNPIEFVMADYDAPMWIYSWDAYGAPTRIISADTWEGAYDACLDDLPTIEPSEVFEAYGFEDQASFDREVELNPDRIELCEGYRYQPNATGTGIVNVGHYEGLEPLTTDYVKRTGIKLSIGIVWD